MGSKKKDPYAVLGVSRNSPLDDIKKAYKAKAREFHPDKNKNDPEATEKFKDVQEAFELLRDKRKRAQYDRFGHMDGNNTGPGTADEFFKEFFNGFTARGGGNASASFFQARSVVSYEIACTLKELYTGTTKTIKLRRTSVTLQRPSEKVLELKIVPGWANGTKVTFKGEGDEIGSTGVAQDVQFIIKEQPHPGFARQGLHLFTRRQISLVEALCGFDLELDILGVKTVKVAIDGDAVVMPGYKMNVMGEGMPNPRLGGPPGDLIVQFEIEFPERLTTDQKEKIREILGQSKSESKL